MATTTTVTSYPWQPDSTKTALRAIGDLGVGLMNALKTQRGIHTETLMTVTGALAGFAAQNAALNSLRVPPGVAPQLEPLAALRKFWLQTLNILTRPPIKQLFRRQEVPLQEIHWPIILGLVASEFMRMSKSSLHPRISAAIIMESAIITSKIDPETLEPGKWRIPTGEAAEPISRLRK
jgi:hypothetical protein